MLQCGEKVQYVRNNHFVLTATDIVKESICGHEGLLLMWEFRARYLWRDQSMIIDIGALAAKPAATVYSPVYRRFLLSSSFYLVCDQTSLNTEILKTVFI